MKLFVGKGLHPLAGSLRKGNRVVTALACLAELETQALERVAAKIGEIVASAGYPVWRLVVPQEIMPALLKALPAAAPRGGRR